MLSIQQVKEILNDPNCSDEEIKQIRESLYDLAQLAFESWGKSDSKNPKRVLPYNLKEVI